MSQDDDVGAPWIAAADRRLIEVQDNLDREADLASLAKAFGYSPFHFHRLVEIKGGKAVVP